MNISEDLKIIKKKYMFYKPNKSLTILLLLGIVSVLVMDIYLKKIPAANEIIYVLGVIYYQLCYAYFASYIFYYITVTLPQKKRKLTLFRFTNNKLLKIESTLKNYISATLNDYSDKHVMGRNFKNADFIDAMDLESIQKVLINRNALQKVTVLESICVVEYENWFDYSNNVHERIREMTFDLLNFSNLLNEDIIEVLLNIEDVFACHINETRGISVETSKLEYYSLDLISLRDLRAELVKLFYQERNNLNHLYHERRYRKNKKNNF